MNIIQDTLSGAVFLSIFDFIACFFVLYFISFFIRALGFLNKIFEKKSVTSA
jgi:hypothetical protein